MSEDTTNGEFRHEHSLSPKVDEGAHERRVRRSRSRSPERKQRTSGPKLYGKEARRVFLSNFPYTMSWQDIKNYIVEKTGEDCFVTLYFDENNRSKGTGICDFRREEGAEKAIDKLHKTDVKGRLVIVRRETERDRERLREESRSGGTQSLASQAVQINQEILWKLGIDPGTVTNRVFVTNLSFNVNQPKLREVFGLAGKITKLDLRMDQKGRSKGCAVITFETVFEAVQAVSMLNGQILFDRQMGVKIDAPRASGMAELPAGLTNIGSALQVNPLVSGLKASTYETKLIDRGLAGLDNVGAYIGTPPLSGIPELIPSGLGRSGNQAGGVYYQQGRSMTSLVPPASHSHSRTSNVLVRNLPYSCHWRHLREKCLVAGDVQFVEMQTNKDGQKNGSAIVKYTNPDDARRAVAFLDGSVFDGHHISAHLDG